MTAASAPFPEARRSSHARHKVSSSLEERRYAQTDANHNVTGVADVFGQVKERFAYDPHGRATVLTAGGAEATDTLDWRYRHQGGRLDAATGLYHFRNRDYSPTLGRFVSADPLGYPDGANRYKALGSNPLSWVDPSGLYSLFDSPAYDYRVVPAGGGRPYTTFAFVRRVPRWFAPDEMNDIGSAHYHPDPNKPCGESAWRNHIRGLVDGLKNRAWAEAGIQKLASVALRVRRRRAENRRDWNDRSTYCAATARVTTKI